ncbi:MAG: hypothetical protein QME74_08325, partial [Candidatus Edwardsbacteria bacterium]|nr:hypothetical protein [Candidatus Edwardsbacteria bacterium]
VLVTNDAIIIKSYDPNFWEKQGVSTDTMRPYILKHNGHFLCLNIDNNVVDIKCRDTLNWKELYNPGYMEFLTVYRDGKWRSWELTRKLMDYLTK